MRILNTEQARQIHAGEAHFHWVCLNKKNYVSKPYYCGLSEVTEVADKHRDKYKGHKKKIFVYTCYRKCRKYGM